MAKITRIIHHNQLLLTKFGNNYTCRRVKWGKDVTYATLATPFRSQILFKARALGSNLLQLKGDSSNIKVGVQTWLPQLHILLYFFSRPSVPDILRLSPEFREVLRYHLFLVQLICYSLNVFSHILAYYCYLLTATIITTWIWFRYLVCFWFRLSRLFGNPISFL